MAEAKATAATAVKEMAVCAGMFPVTSQPFAKSMVDDLKAKEIPGAVIAKAADPGYIRVQIPAKTEDEAKKILDAMRKVGYTGYVFEI